MMYTFFIVVIMAGLMHLWSKSKFTKSIDVLDGRVFSSPNRDCRQPVHLDSLPDLVQSLAKRSGADLKRPIRGVRFRQSAKFRMAPDKAWKSLETRQAISATAPGFVWFAEQKMGPFTILGVVDAYMSGQGLLKARLFGSVPVANFDGPGIAHSELMRYLAELAWIPDAIYYNHYLRWIILGNNVVQVETDSDGGPAFIHLYFDQQGDLVEIRADQREAIEGGKTVCRPWRGVFSDYKNIGGRRIPIKGEVGYIYDDGYAAYFLGEIVEYEVLAD